MSKRYILLLGLLLVLGFGVVAAQEGDAPIRIIFMHHSTGAGVLYGGQVRESLTQLGYELWDHAYNEEGLNDANGQNLGYNWNMPDDNTDPVYWYYIFNQTVTDPPSNTFSHMLEYDVIIFKSCFPNAAIYDEGMLQTYRDYFLSIRDVIDQYPDKIFIAWTIPPLVPNETDADQAARARRWAEYLTSAEYLDGHPNLYVFDFFNLMADETGFLREEYRTSEDDSHPNDIGNALAGPILVQFVDAAIQNYTPGEPGLRPVLVFAEDGAPRVALEDETGELTVLEPLALPAASEGGDESAGGGPAGPSVRPDSDVIADFAAADSLDYWWTYEAEGVEPPLLELAEPGYSADNALRVTFAIPAGQYGGFGTDFYPTADLSAAAGLRFFWHSEQTGNLVAIILFVEDAATGERTPFETHRETPGGEWTEIQLTWAEFVKPDWVGDAGVAEFDVTRIAGISFELGNWERAQADTIWLDDIGLIGN